MIIYFDKRGVLREVIDDLPTRAGSSNVNKIYAFVERDGVTSASFLSDGTGAIEGTVTLPTTLTLSNTDGTGLLNVGDRDLKYFQLFKEYDFWVYEMQSYDMTEGLRSMTVRAFSGTTSTSAVVLAAGKYVYEVEGSNILPDTSIGQNEYDYLLAKVGGNYSKSELDTLFAGKRDIISTTSTNDRVYTKSSDGTESSVDYSSNAVASQIVQRDDSGDIKVPLTPTEDADATSKSYVDTATYDMATKTYVDTKVEEYAPTFRGLFETYALLLAYTGEKNKNDYAVVNTDETHSGQTSRYNYNGTAWVYEYKLSDTKFTTEQMAAINSGITSTKVATYDNYATAKQDTLVAGTNIRNVNGQSILGEGNLLVQSVLESGTNIKTINSQSILGSGDLEVQEKLVSGTNVKTVNGQSVLGSGDIPTPMATDTDFGGIKAQTVSDTTGMLEIKIDTNGKLWCGAVGTMEIQIVSTLPATGSLGVMYLVPMTEQTEEQKYKEYIWVIESGVGRYELLGQVRIDLSNYYTKTETDATFQTKLTFDDTPTAMSDNPVKSGGVLDALNLKQNKLPQTAESWKFLRSTTERGVVEWDDLPLSEVADVKVDGTSVVEGRTAIIPKATSSQFGVVKPDGATILMANGITSVNTTTIEQTANKATSWGTVNNTKYPTTKLVKDTIDTKSAVSVSESGSSTDQVNYITIDGTQYKIAGSGGSGTTNYNDLENKPSIAGVMIIGNKALNEYGMQSVANLVNTFDSALETTYPNTALVKTELGKKIDKTSIVDDLTSTDNTKVLSAKQGKALKDLLDDKQDNLTFDSTPTANSDNPVKSKGIKSYVDNAVSTGSASFLGNKNVVTDLELTTSATQAQVIAALAVKVTGAVNGDYVYVTYPNATDPTKTDKTERYKYNGTAWAFEYALENTNFTTEQNAAINSGITSDKVSSYDDHIADEDNPHNVTKAQLGLGNVDNTSDANKPISTATQTALDTKVTANTAITSGTYTKVTVDSKGLVTEGADITLSDLPAIPESKVTNLVADLATKVGTDKIVNNLNSTDTSRVLSAAQGKILNDNLTNKQDVLTFDTTPTSGSTNPVTSGGIYTAMQSLGSLVIRNIDATPIEATEATVSTIASAYITTNYSREPQTNDALYITIDSSIKEYAYQNGNWIKVGEPASVDLSAYARKENVLEKTNTTEFTPSSNYNPATKKYVDDAVAPKSTVTVSTTGTTSSQIRYITVNGIEYKIAGDGTVIDNELSTTSTNPVQNKVITQKINELSTGLKFKGYISTTEPTTDIQAGTLWYESSTLPTTFPINVKEYDGTSWSATTQQYNVKALDLWSLLAVKEGYYWFSGEWNRLDKDIKLDNDTITTNASGEIQVNPDLVVKINNSLKETATFPNYDSTLTYAVGSIVTHEREIYECNTIISTPEEWDSSKWTKKDVKYLLGLKQNQLQYDALPTASADYVGKVYQYTGATTTTAPIYNHNYWYECQEVTPSTTPATYHWVEQEQGKSQLSNLTDVQLTSLADGQILKWDATNSKWINSTSGSGGDTIEVGTIITFAQTTTPSGYVKCDGTLVDKAGTYASLWTAVGYKFTDGWEVNTSYLVGDYVIHNNSLYQCITAHTSGSAFESEYWEENATQFQLPYYVDTEVNYAIKYAYSAPSGTAVLIDEVGTIKEIGYDGLPNGTLACDGSMVLRGVYSELFDKIGYTWTDAWAASTAYALDDYVKNSNKLYKCIEAHTSGDTFESEYWEEDTTHFFVPDMRNKYIKGWGALSVGAIQEAGLPDHTHTRGTMEITGSASNVALKNRAWSNTYSGAFSYSTWDAGESFGSSNAGAGVTLQLKASDNWTGSTSGANVGTGNTAVYGKSTTVDVDAVVVKYCIVYTKTLGTTSMPDNTTLHLDSDGNIAIVDSYQAKINGALQSTDVVDNLTSTETTKPLSANQGKALNDSKANTPNVWRASTSIGGGRVYMTICPETNRVDVATNGTFTIEAGATVYVSLSGISFTCVSGSRTGETKNFNIQCLDDQWYTNLLMMNPSNFTTLYNCQLYTNSTYANLYMYNRSTVATGTLYIRGGGSFLATITELDS